ncbi:MAG: BREX-1 system phosphatase PglZ type A, partial [Endozoicomonadaceae bacterium]|nr:BREX-1 system phosphatase PglZ type A [Endozoicomonadaceae bacterium]
MTSRISTALRRLLDKHRIVFWYDDKQELKQEFDALELPKVEKIEINNNEFSIKHRVLREQPKQQFVLYKQGLQPEPVKNWLLDIELAYAVFRTDQVAIWLSELELPNEFTELIAAHSAFFEVNGSSDKAKSKAEERKIALKQFILPEDTHNQIRLRMLAVAAGASHKGDARLDVVLELLLDELSNNKSSTYEFLKQC